MAEVLRVSGELEVAEVKLTIGFVTSRNEPKFDWFAASLISQLQPDDTVNVIVVDYFHDKRGHFELEGISRLIGRGSQTPVQHVNCMPTIWQGQYQLPREPWWSKSAYLNTCICLCETDFIAFTDDRVVLRPQWLQCVRDAQAGNYAVCGSYEKRANMKVENGEIIEHGDLLGVDTRAQYGEPVSSHDWYGGSCALPLEWCLAVQGFSMDLCDGLGSEDSMFGVTLHNSGYPMKFDSRMRIIEDRTPSEIDGALKRADKNPHLGQKAKSWDIVRAFQGKTTSQNSFDIRDMRARILNGEDWRPPSASHVDWYDGQQISEME